MDREYIAAFTETEYDGSYPAYISINRDSGGKIVITARERGHDGNKSVNIEISEIELKALAFSIMKKFRDEEEIVA